MSKEEKLLLRLFYDINSYLIQELLYKDGQQELINKITDDILEDKDLDIHCLRKYYKLLLTPDFLSRAYQELLEGSFFTSSLDLPDIVITLCRYYIALPHVENDDTYQFINNNSINDIYLLFKRNEAFASKLIHIYFLAKIYNIKDNNIIFNNEISARFPKERVFFLTDHIRSLYENCMNILYYNVGLSHEQADGVMYLILTGRINELADLDKFPDFKELSAERNLMLRIIYSDLYEDLKYEDLYSDEPYLSIKNNLLYNIQNKVYMLPHNEDALLILDRFNYLIYNPGERELNRNALSENEIKILRKINPLFKTERIMLGYENK